mmetsp:Transcript_29982/g.56046  ORF Transcript_29982/g.56046 Transcript_29982/m.56046 type:complete len:454 (-) Transcript_29982:263-1624(-)
MTFGRLIRRARCPSPRAPRPSRCPRLPKRRELRGGMYARSLASAKRKSSEVSAVATEPAVPSMLPGLAASALVMQGGFWGAEGFGKVVLAAQGLDPSGSSPVSGIPVAILLGAGLRRYLGDLPEMLKPGVALCTTTVLRAGIVCVGAKLSALEMASLGVAGAPAVVACIGTGLVFVTWLGARVGLPPRLSALLAAGTSICGVTAITALAPVIGATQREVSYAVANVVVFGTLGMLCYPYLAHHLFEHSEQIGIFLGLSIHDTSQVMAAALTYKQVFADEIALKTAAVTKLTRNVLLATVLPALAWHTASSGEGKEGSAREKKKTLTWSTLKKCLPLFVLGFIGTACLRSIGDAMLDNDQKAYGYFEAEEWKTVTNTIGSQIGGRYLLGTAMAGVGLSMSVANLKEGGLGMRPFLVGSSGALVVGSAGIASVMMLTQLGLIPAASRKSENHPVS